MPLLGQFPPSRCDYNSKESLGSFWCLSLYRHQKRRNNQTCVHWASEDEQAHESSRCSQYNDNGSWWLNANWWEWLQSAEDAMTVAKLIGHPCLNLHQLADNCVPFNGSVANFSYALHRTVNNDLIFNHTISFLIQSEYNFPSQI